jgi:hypothetical protein
MDDYCNNKLLNAFACAYSCGCARVIEKEMRRELDVEAAEIDPRKNAAIVSVTECKLNGVVSHRMDFRYFDRFLARYLSAGLSPDANAFRAPAPVAQIGIVQTLNDIIVPNDFQYPTRAIIV